MKITITTEEVQRIVSDHLGTKGYMVAPSDVVPVVKDTRHGGMEITELKGFEFEAPLFKGGNSV